MIIYCDNKLRTYRDATEWKMIERDCMEWCCDKLKSACHSEGALSIRSYTNTDDDVPPVMLSIKGGEDYYSGEYTNDEEIEFCPFCGDNIEVIARFIDEVPYVECLECHAVMKEIELDKHMSGHFDKEVEKELAEQKQKILDKVKAIKTQPINYKEYIQETECKCNGRHINDECFIHGIKC